MTAPPSAASESSPPAKRVAPLKPPVGLTPGRLGHALTARELETLRHIANGESYKMTARALGVSPTMIKKRLRLVRAKLGAVNTAHAIVLAMRQGLL